MLLSQISVDPDRYQFRDTPYSEKTVAGIVAEGIVLAKYDPIPVVRRGGNRWIVGGAGHSRFEAIRRLAAARRLPREWRRNRGWDVPVRKVSAAEAQLLAWTENLSRDDFKPCEEAAVFQSMLDAGRSVDQVAEVSHRTTVYVQKALTLNTLCRDIRAAVGASPAAGGIDVLTAQVLANGFKRFGVTPDRQQDLWHRCLKHAMLNFQSAKKFVDAIGGRLSEKQTEGVLFEMPVNAGAVIADARTRSQAFRSAKMGLALLLKAHEAGGLSTLPELATWIERHGTAALDDLGRRVTEDADVLAAMFAAA